MRVCQFHHLGRRRNTLILRHGRGAVKARAGCGTVPQVQCRWCLCRPHGYGIMIAEALMAGLYFGLIGPTEIVIILVIALLVFGPDKLPEIGRQIGSIYRELNRMRGDMQRALDLDEYSRYDVPSY